MQDRIRARRDAMRQAFEDRRQGTVSQDDTEQLLERVRVHTEALKETFALLTQKHLEAESEQR